MRAIAMEGTPARRCVTPVLARSAITPITSISVPNEDVTMSYLMLRISIALTMFAQPVPHALLPKKHRPEQSSIPPVWAAQSA